MSNHEIIPMIAVVIFCFSLLLFYISYIRYRDYMKKNHHDEWEKLTNRDPLINACGEWIRWPVGSIYFLLSVFDLSRHYDDLKLNVLKQRTYYLFIIFIISILALMLIAVLLPK